MVAKVRQTLSVSKEAAQKFDMEKFNCYQLPFKFCHSSAWLDFKFLKWCKNAEYHKTNHVYQNF